MPTGFEAVGLALAIFPVLVEGLRFYEREKGTLKDWLHYRRVIKQHARDLDRENIAFRNSCRIFLENVAVRSDLDVEDIGPMMQDRDDPRWKQGVWLQEGVLDLVSVQSYLAFVDDMKNLLVTIGERLGIRENAPPEVLDKTTRNRQWKIFRTIILKAEIQELFDKTHRLNNQLAQLTSQTRPAAPARRPHKFVKHYKQIRSHAMDLCHMLKLKFPTPPRCTCTLPHQVNIRLEFRNAKTADQVTSFHTIFTLEPLEPSHCPSIPWREIELQHYSTDEGKQHSSGSTGPTHQKTHVKPASTSVKKVGFATMPSRTCLDPSCKEIQDLCIFIAQHQASTDWVGFITDGQSRKHRLRDIHRNHVLSANSRRPNIMSLAQAFAHKPASREARSRLGVKLASSVMQLHSTEWLADSWGAENVFFLEAADGTADITNPLLQRGFGTLGQSQTASSSPVRDLPYVACLQSLGIILLELWHWKPFGALKTDDEMAMAAQAPVYSDQIAAGRLLTLMDDAGPRYISAVKRCIFGLDAAYTSLEEDKFQGEVEEKIVFPLEEHLKFYCNKESIEECL